MEAWQVFAVFLIPALFALIIGAYEAGFFDNKEEFGINIFIMNIIDVDHPDSDNAYTEYYGLQDDPDKGQTLKQVDINLKNRFHVGPALGLTPEQEKFPFIGIYRKVIIGKKKISHRE